MAQNTVISYPIPAYQNLPIEPQFYKPSQFPITGITLGITTLVTMGESTNDVAPNYVIGQQVRLIIPSAYGSRGLSGRSGIVISVPSSDTVEINIDSTGVDPFIASPALLPKQNTTLPQILAIGDVNSGVMNTMGNMNTSTAIPGSFQNISPQ